MSEDSEAVRIRRERARRLAESLSSAIVERLTESQDFDDLVSEGGGATECFTCGNRFRCGLGGFPIVARASGE